MRKTVLLAAAFSTSLTFSGTVVAGPISQKFDDVAMASARRAETAALARANQQKVESLSRSIARVDLSSQTAASIKTAPFPPPALPNVPGVGRTPSYLPRIADRASVRSFDKGHRFPYSFDKEILGAQPTMRSDGSYLYRKPGTLNGTAGNYEVTVNPEGNHIFHRTFKRDN